MKKRKRIANLTKKERGLTQSEKRVSLISQLSCPSSMRKDASFFSFEYGFMVLVGQLGFLPSSGDPRILPEGMENCLTAPSLQ